MAAAQAVGSSGATSQPVTPSTTVSVVPPWLEAITGRPMAWGSTAVRPKVSGTVVGRIATSASR